MLKTKLLRILPEVSYLDKCETIVSFMYLVYQGFLINISFDMVKKTCHLL